VEKKLLKNILKKGRGIKNKVVSKIMEKTVLIFCIFLAK